MEFATPRERRAITLRTDRPGERQHLHAYFRRFAVFLIALFRVGLQSPFWRVWVVAVAVFFADFAILAVGNVFCAFTSSCVTSSLFCFFLRRVDLVYSV